MRLLNARTLEFKEFWGDDIPKYFIASHRWGPDEPTYNTFAEHRARQSEGYKKIVGFCTKLHTLIMLRIEWLWIDTCCIDKTNSVELGEAINSMFKWYQNAEFCAVYLQDIRSDQLDEISESVWFTRGWTLQELLAPSCVIFYKSDWAEIGVKGGHKKLLVRPGSKRRRDEFRAMISETTGIPTDVLWDFKDASKLSVDERMAWMTSRRTTRPEDRYYSMLGLFGVYMAPIYGEGAQHARRRLMREIKDSQNSTEEINSDNPGASHSKEESRTASESGANSENVAGFHVRDEVEQDDDDVYVYGTANLRIPKSLFRLPPEDGWKYTLITYNGDIIKVREDGWVMWRTDAISLNGRAATLSSPSKTPSKAFASPRSQ